MRVRAEVQGRMVALESTDTNFKVQNLLDKEGAESLIASLQDAVDVIDALETGDDMLRKEGFRSRP